MYAVTPSLDEKFPGVPAVDDHRDNAGQAEVPEHPQLTPGPAPGRHSWLRSLRGSLIVIVLIALLPAAVFAVWDAARSYRNEVTARQVELSRLSRFVVNDQHTALTTARALLMSLASLPEVRSFGPSCSSTVTAAMESLQESGFTAIGAVDAQGNWRCGSSLLDSPQNFRDRRWFADIQSGREWVVSELLDSRVLEARGFVVAVPLAAGTQTGALSLMVEAERFARTYRSAMLGAGATFVFLDRDGRAVTSEAHAAEVLTTLPEDTSAIVRMSASSETHVAFGRDGTRRLYTVLPLFNGQLRVLAGVPADSVYGPLHQQLVARLLPPLLMLLLAAAVTWIGVDRLFLRWLRYLRGVTRLYASDSTAARATPPPSAPEEIRHIASDLTRMAHRIETRERGLRDSLANRELLVREVHHRVKNNLQMVISLLSLHSRKVSDGDARRVFEDASARLGAIALVHRRLQETANLEVVVVDGFLRELCTDLQSVRPEGTGDVDLAVSAASVTLPADVAVPLGLFVNEAVMNAYKHAFVGRREGRIDVVLDVSPADDCIRLTISDDGVGADRSVGHEGLGMTLIRGFATQLGGTVEVTMRDGTRVTLVFPRAPAH